MKHIVRNWDELSERVDREANEQIEIEKQIMKERFKRFRDKQENDEQPKNHAASHDPADQPHQAPEADKENHMDNGNPFKPIHEVIEKTASKKQLANGKASHINSNKIAAVESTATRHSRAPGLRRSKSSSPRKQKESSVLRDIKVQRMSRSHSPNKVSTAKNRRERTTAIAISTPKHRTKRDLFSNGPQLQTPAAATKVMPPSNGDLSSTAKSKKRKAPTIFSSNKITPLA